jgi:hypothetical protein
MRTPQVESLRKKVALCGGKGPWSMLLGTPKAGKEERHDAELLHNCDLKSRYVIEDDAEVAKVVTLQVLQDCFEQLLLAREETDEFLKLRRRRQSAHKSHVAVRRIKEPCVEIHACDGSVARGKGQGGQDVAPVEDNVSYCAVESSQSLRDRAPLSRGVMFHNPESFPRMSIRALTQPSTSISQPRSSVPNTWSFGQHNSPNVLSLRKWSE